jgi:hypothetical protein
MNEQELQEARTNPEFLNFLQEREKEAYEKQDIALFYEVLDSLLVLNLEEDRINKVYNQILKISFDKVEVKLKNNNKLTLENDDIYYIRSFYEHAIEKWSYENFDGAKELFFVLSNIIEDKKLYDAIQVLIIACANKITIDQFYDTQVEQNFELDNEKYGYFIINFKFNTKQYLKKNSVALTQIHNKLKHLLD